jgi:hypothetical protein
MFIRIFIIFLLEGEKVMYRKAHFGMIFITVFLIAIMLGTVNPVFSDFGSLTSKIGKGIKKAGKNVEETGVGIKNKLDVPQLVKKAKKELRTAEKDMFSGKKDSAIIHLKKAAAMINTVKKADPRNNKLKSLESKRDKLKKDLEKRTGKKIDLAPQKKKAKDLPSDVESLIKLAEKDLREAERKMHKGQNDEAKKQLDDVAVIIKKIKTTDPENKKLATLESKLANTTKTVDKKLGKTMEKSSGRSAKAPAGKKIASKKDSGGEKLPFHCRKVMQKIDREFKRLDDSLDEIPGADAEMKRIYIKRVPQKMQEIEKMLIDAKEKAAEKDVTEHDSFNEVERHLTEAGARFEKLKTGLDQEDAAAGEMAKGVAGDVEKLNKILEPLKNTIFSKATGTALYYNDLNPVIECIEMIEKFEKNDLAKAQKALDEFSTKYGNTPDEVEKKTDELGYQGNRQPKFIFKNMKEGIEKVARTRVVMAEDLVKKLDAQLNGLPSKHDFYRMEMHERAREWMEMAERYDPANEKVEEAKSSIEAKLAEDTKKLLKKIDKQSWPGNTSGGDAKAALKFFKEDKGWGKNKKTPQIPLGVSVIGSWSIQKKDILGKPIMYGLPVLIAVQHVNEKKDKLARVFSVTMRTEEMAGARKKPPFVSITVGNSYFIRSKKVK